VLYKVAPQTPTTGWPVSCDFYFNPAPEEHVLKNISCTWITVPLGNLAYLIVHKCRLSYIFHKIARVKCSNFSHLTFCFGKIEKLFMWWYKINKEWQWIMYL